MEGRSHLFISYASEDVEVAAWLARKLAARGYAVWFDHMKLLGGEQWPRVIEDAIDNRTFRMIALISENSKSKKKPQGERVRAEKVGEREGITDFLIPVLLDRSELDWLTTVTQCIFFNEGLAEGWRRLIKKLDSIDTPRPLADGAALAKTTFPRGEELVSMAPENVFVNVIEVQEFPRDLLLYKPTHLTTSYLEAVAEIWPYAKDQTELISIVPPISEEPGLEAPIEVCDWTEVDRWRNRPTRDFAAELLMKAINIKGMLNGWLPDPNPKHRYSYYLPESYRADGWLRFSDQDGGNRKLKIKGKATFSKPGERELNNYHLGFRLRLARGLDKALYLQVRPTVVLFGPSGEAIRNRSVTPRRKRLTRSWYNEKWRIRLLAAFYLIGELDLSEFGIRLSTIPLVLNSPVSINESLLEPVEEEDEEGVFEITEEDNKVTEEEGNADN